MISRRPVAVAVALLAVALWAAVGHAVGVDLRCEIIALDVKGAYGRVPAALGVSSDALLALFADQGLSPGELADIEADLDAAVADVTTALSTFPGFLAIPLVGAAAEIPLSLFVLDAVRVSAGILDSALARSIADAAGVEIPSPLLDQEFDVGDQTARFTGDLDVSAWTVSVEAVKRFDFFLAAFDLSAGVDYTSCAATVSIQREVPAGWQEGVDAALAALHLDEVRGAALSAHVGGRLELGVPFFRIYVQARLVEPIVERVGWWDVHIGRLAGSVGVVIRF